MKKIVLNNNEYEIIKDEKSCFNYEEVIEKFTDYFDEFDYILGDYSYEKLRMKGFCKKNNKNLKEFNDYKNIDAYLEKFCSYGCRYFILEKNDKKA